MTDTAFDPDCRRCGRLADFLDQVKSEYPGYSTDTVPDHFTGDVASGWRGILFYRGPA